MRPASAPTERSIWPATITSTMPTARMAVTEVWRASSERLRGRRNVPPVVMENTIQMTTRAPTMMSERQGTERPARGAGPAPAAATGAPGGGGGGGVVDEVGLVAALISSHPHRRCRHDRLRRRLGRAQ